MAFTYTTLNPPSGMALANGVNDSGQVVGSIGLHGFILSGGVYSILDAPGATNGTSAYGINASGQIVGSYSDGVGSHGFLLNGGAYTTLNDPLATAGTSAFGINSLGQIVGSYSNASGIHGFLYSGGVYTAIDDPLASSSGTQANGINSSGQIVGTYGNATGNHGFFYNSGTFTTIDDTGATTGTSVQGINDGGQIVGIYGDSVGFHGFLKNGSTFTTLDDPLATSTGANGIANGLVVGTYFDSSGAHGWLSASSAAGFNLVDDAITKLYVGYFNRAPDPAGETYWVGQMNRGLNIAQIAQSFSVQKESTDLYAYLQSPNASSPAAVKAFVDAIYANLFNRAPDAAGETYWMNQLQSGASTAGGAIQNITSGAQANDSATLANKVTVGDYYDAQLFSHSVQFTVASAKDVVSGVTFDPASVSSGEAKVDAYVQTAPHSSMAAEIGIVGVTPSGPPGLS